MQQMRLLHKKFAKELPFIHKTRLNCLMSTCTTASTSNTLFLTGLGRAAISPTKTSSNIEKVNRLLGNKHLQIVLYKGKSKNRHKRNLNKKICASGTSKKHSKAAKEPWLLVTSLPQARNNPGHIVNIYRQRMRIEENFRDTKCPHYGLGLKKSLTRDPGRMAILLLIAAIATWAAWLAGLITILAGNASDFQAHSAKFTQSLSIVYLGREVIKKQLLISHSQLLNAINTLAQMVVNAQLEKGLYE